MTPRFLTLNELAELPEPTYLLEPFIVAGGLTVLFGPSNTFKTFVAIDWALRVAAADWNVVYVAAEGASGISKRVKAWQEHGPQVHDGVLFVPEPVNLASKRDVDRFIGSDDADGWDLGRADPALLVIDTFSRCMAGADENSAQDVSAAVGGLDRIRGQIGCSVVVIHHTGHSDTERERGSSALGAAADIRVRAKPAGVRQVRLECARVRDAAEFDPLTVRMLQVNGSLVAAQAAAREDVIDQAVREHLEAHPAASQRDVEDAVTGRREDVRAAYKRLRPVRPTPGRTPGQGAPRAPSLKGRGRSPDLDDPTLDPDEHMRARTEDGGW